MTLESKSLLENHDIYDSSLKNFTDEELKNISFENLTDKQLKIINIAQEYLKYEDEEIKDMVIETIKEMIKRNPEELDEEVNIDDLKAFIDETKEKIKEIKMWQNKYDREIKSDILELMTSIKTNETLIGWEGFENIADELYYDINDLIDKSDMSFIVTCSKLDYEKMDIPGLDTVLNKRFTSSVKDFFDDIGIILQKYLSKITTLIEEGLKDDFQNVPEPTKTYLINNEILIKENMTMLKRIPSGFETIKRAFIGKNEITPTVFINSLEKVDIKHIVVPLENLVTTIFCSWKDGEEYDIIFRELDTQTAALFAGLKCDCLKFSELESIDSDIAIELANFTGKEIRLNKIKNLDEATAIELAKFKGDIYLQGLETLNKPTAALLAGQKYDSLVFSRLESIDVEVATELVNFQGNELCLWEINEIDEETAMALIPIKSKLQVKNNIMRKIEEVETRINENLSGLQEGMQKTKSKKDWREQRENLKYDRKTKKIESRGKETDVEEFSGNNMKLKGLDLSLTSEEGMWLANFKNRVKYKKDIERHKDVKYSRGVANKSFAYRKTLYVGNTMLMSRKDLIKRIPSCEDDKVVEKICEWLNK